jgi:hypothetical protein
MSGVYRKRLAIVLICLAGVTWGGCAGKRAWRWPWQKAPPTEVADIPSPAETIAKIKKMGDAAPSATPEAQEQSAGQLTEMIRKENDPVIRTEIVRALGKHTVPSATQTAISAMKDPDTDVRVAACETLGRRGGPQAVTALCDALKIDLEPEVRMSAAKALGQTHDTSAVAVLGAALSDEDPAMQYLAVQSLKQISGKDFGNDVNLWRQYARGESPPEPSLAERVRRLF